MPAVMPSPSPGAAGARDGLAAAAGAAFLLLVAALAGPIAPMGIATGVCGALTLARFARMARPGSPPATRPAWPHVPMNAAGAIWLLALLIASVFALDPAASFPRVTKGLMPALVGLAALNVPDRASGRRALAVYLAAAGLVAAWGAGVWWAHGHGYAWRARGLAHHYMTYGGQLLLEFPVALAVALTARERRWRAFAGVVAALTAVGLATTFTRSAWIGSFVAGLLIAAAVWPWALLGVGGAAAAAWLFVGGQWGARLHSIVQPHEGYNGERLLMWQAGWRMLRAHPLTGVGLEDMHEVYPRFKSPQATEAVGHLHNSYVQIAATMGLIGLGAFAVLVAALLRTAARGIVWTRGLAARLRGDGLEGGLRVGVTAAVVGMLVAGMFEWNFGDEELLYHLYVLVGLAWASAAWAATARREAPR